MDTVDSLIEKITSGEDKLIPLMRRLEVIYKSMDEKYNDAANHYGFCCGGCEENCCLTRFYHHTFAEYLYLHKGVETLGLGIRAEIRERAVSVCMKTAELDRAGLAVRLLCPLNYEGMCVLYEYRPMICRLHGLPHEIIIPGSGKKTGPGCGEFNARCGGKEYLKFDRTPFYTQMAGLEKDFKEAFGISERIKMTVAQMLATL
jgi:Fe-S-cluster containining protein